MNHYKTTRKAGFSGLLALCCALLLSACDTSAVVDPAEGISPVVPHARVEVVDLPLEAISAITSPKTLVRALDDRVFVKARTRAAAATPEQIQALVLAREAAQAVVDVNGDVPADVLNDMMRKANAAMEPFINPEDAAYLAAAVRRLNELGVTSEDVPALTKSLEVEGALAKTGPCDRACAAAYTNNIAAIELAYLGGLLGCTFSGPVSLLCFAGATAVKSITIISSTLEYTTCVDACRETS